MPCGAHGGRAVGHLCTGHESCLRPPGGLRMVTLFLTSARNRPGGAFSPASAPGSTGPDRAAIADKMLFMVAAMAAEMERDLIRERTLDGLRAAEAQGRRGGRPAAVNKDVLAVARARQSRGESVTAIARHRRSAGRRCTGRCSRTSAIPYGPRGAGLVRPGTPEATASREGVMWQMHPACAPGQRNEATPGHRPSRDTPASALPARRHGWRDPRAWTRPRRSYDRPDRTSY
jgi:hypothetical protein